jgi:hypothetical protein
MERAQPVAARFAVCPIGPIATSKSGVVPACSLFPCRNWPKLMPSREAPSGRIIYRRRLQLGENGGFAFSPTKCGKGNRIMTFAELHDCALALRVASALSNEATLVERILRIVRWYRLVYCPYCCPRILPLASSLICSPVASLAYGEIEGESDDRLQNFRRPAKYSPIFSVPFGPALGLSDSWIVGMRGSREGQLCLGKPNPLSDYN